MSADPGSAASLKNKGVVRRLVNALRYSADGLAAAWRHEGAFRMEVVAAAALVPAACVLPVTLVERILLAAVVVLVLVAELVNSALEAAIDRDSLRIDALGKRAKDLGSAAVFVTLLLAAGTWLAILWNRFAP